VNFEIPGTLGLIYNFKIWEQLEQKTRCYPLFYGIEFFETHSPSDQINFVMIDANMLFDSKNDFLKKLSGETNVVLIVTSSNTHAMAEQRRIFIELIVHGIKCPVLIKREYTQLPETNLQLQASTDAGALLLDGFGDGIWIDAFGKSSEKNINALAFGILQATRTRISKTEYISCPSCGRTLFDLQETTARIRARTNHLKGLKIGIMGCIVNGPGEMADADFGYVGSGPGKITLYKGKEIVKRNVNSDVAVEELINLLKDNEAWIEPASV
jgi:(E)-4-hydroxy-3-methylbut-2-enyl-diphosphate synthase